MSLNKEISNPTRESIEELVSGVPESFVKSYTTKEPEDNTYAEIVQDLELQRDKASVQPNKKNSYIKTWVKPDYVKTWAKAEYKKTWTKQDPPIETKEEEYPRDYLDLVKESLIIQKLEERGIHNISKIKRDAQGNALSVSGYNEKTKTPHTSIAIEKIEGVTMDNYSFGNPREIVETFVKVAKTMKEINREGILYNDIKPKNIMMTKEGEPIIIDFDAYGYLEKDGVKVIKGTPAYDSPEKKAYLMYTTLFTKSPVGIPSDIYSFTLTLADIVGIDIYELTQGNTSSLSDFVEKGKIDEKLASFIRINISGAPKDRMQSFDEVENYLKSINEKPV
jgi:serine/threonine protein kinase